MKIFECVKDEEILMIVDEFNKQEPVNQRVTLDIDPRSILLRNFLVLISGWLAFLMYFRFFHEFFRQHNSELQVIFAILATVVPMLEKMAEGKISTPEAYIWTRTFMGSIKGLLMVSVFVINGLANDFFMGLFFFFTTNIGLVFFTMNPYSDPQDDSKML